DNEEIEVVQFVPSEQVDPIMLERSYYLEPEGKSPKSYLLLRQTLEATDRTAIVRFALRQKTRLGALRVDGKVLVLQGLLWADEVREVDFPNTKSRAKISDQELELSAALVDQYASDFTPEKFEDEYQVQLRKLIDAKFESGDTIDTEATFGEVADADGGDGDGDGDSDEGEDAEVIDLMEALKASLGKRRGGGSGDSAKKKDSGSGKSGDDKDDTGGTDDKKSGKSGGGKKTAKKSAKKSASKSKKKSSGSKSAGPKSSNKKSSRSKSSAKKTPTKKSSGKKSGKSGGKSAKSSGSGKKSGKKSA
uniref:non-homologous end joining protein Ku n=1 Tax=uncultured Corynebacterium sp. TaxID=159447 RepID=UPI00260B1FFF